MRSFRRHIPRLFLAYCLLAAASGAGAHEIPSDVRIQIIVRPAGTQLELLVRAPLEAMRDIEFPTVGPGYLDLEAADDELSDAAQLWLANSLVVYEDGKPLERPRLITARASIPSDRSFAAYGTAAAHLSGPTLASSTQLVWQQALLDARFELPISASDSRFSISADFDRLGLRVVTAIRFVAPDGRERIFELRESETLPLDPRWHQAGLRFVQQGFEHILDGLDHILFILCLVLPFRRDVRRLVWIVTAFTVAHSITLIGSAYGFAPGSLWFAPLVEVLIAGSILYLAVENVVAPKIRTRWTLAFGFGLVHGFGFSFALRETLQFAGDHVLLSLLSFNIGVELGQLLVLGVLIPLLIILFKFVRREWVATLIIGVFIAHTSWHWLIERATTLSAFWAAS